MERIRSTNLQGIAFYLNPDWSALTNPDLWFSAAGQVLFSLAVGSGGLTTMASYNARTINPFQ